MRVVIVVNPFAGTGRSVRTATSLASMVESAGHEVEVIETQPVAPEQWLGPRLRGADRLLVVGGDGAIRMVASVAAEAGVPIRHVPFGTENLFARSFRATRKGRDVLCDLEGACTAIDIASVGGDSFVLMASAGLDADVVHDLATRRSGPISHLSYLRPILRNLVRWRASALTVRLNDGHEFVRGERGAIIVANMSAYALRIDPVARADPADGLLDVLFLPARHAGHFAAWMGRSRVRCDLQKHGARHVRAEAFTIWGDPPVRWQIDGDPHSGDPASFERPAEFSVSPRTLRVVSAFR